MGICKTCLGAGRVSCGCCWNKNIRPVCPDCGGNGTLPGKTESVCTRCQGLGHIFPQSCPACGNSLVCPECGGKGALS